MIKQAEELQALADELLHLGEDGGAVYIDKFCRLNQEIREKADQLSLLKSEDAQQEAQLCLGLLMAYSVMAYPGDCYNQKIQFVLDRCSTLLSHHTRTLQSFVKGKLLIYCYYFIRDKELEREIQFMIDSLRMQKNVMETEELSILYQTVASNITC